MSPPGRTARAPIIQSLATQSRRRRVGVRGDRGCLVLHLMITLVQWTSGVERPMMTVGRLSAAACSRVYTDASLGCLLLA